MQAICKPVSSHYLTALDTESAWIHTAKEVNTESGHWWQRTLWNN